MGPLFEQSAQFMKAAVEAEMPKDRKKFEDAEFENLATMVCSYTLQNVIYTRNMAEADIEKIRSADDDHVVKMQHLWELLKKVRMSWVELSDRGLIFYKERLEHIQSLLDYIGTQSENDIKNPSDGAESTNVTTPATVMI